jgi:hypothetical protein
MSSQTIRASRAITFAFLAAGFLLSGCGGDNSGIDVGAAKQVAADKGVSAPGTMPGEAAGKKAPTGGLTQPKPKGK